MNVWFEGKLITEHCPACASPMPFYPKCYRCGHSDPVMVPKEELLSLPSQKPMMTKVMTKRIRYEGKSSCKKMIPIRTLDNGDNTQERVNPCNLQCFGVRNPLNDRQPL